MYSKSLAFSTCPGQRSPAAVMTNHTTPVGAGYSLLREVLYRIPIPFVNGFLSAHFPKNSGSKEMSFSKTTRPSAAVPAGRNP